jgi:opacity protein-like surface antigen
MYGKLVIAGAALALQAGLAEAQERDAGFYGGFDLGRSDFHASASGPDGALANQGIAGSSSLDRRDTAYGLNLGYRVSRYWAVETAYTRLGEFGYASNVTAPAADTVQGSYKVNALSLSALGFVPLQSSWSLYGKAGLARSDTTFSANSATGATAVTGTSAHSTGLLVGVGAMYDINRSLYTRAGWDHYADVGSDATGKASINTFNVGIGMRF